MKLLWEALCEGQKDVASDIQVAAGEEAQRRLEALQIASYKLDRLEGHLEKASVLLDYLHMLRRILLGEHPLDVTQAEDGQ